MANMIPRSWLVMLSLFVVPHTAMFSLKKSAVETEHNPCQNTAWGNVAHPSSCKVYYSCRRHHPSLEKCPPKSLYKTDLKVCYPAEFVTCDLKSTGVRNKINNQRPALCRPLENFQKVLFHRGMVFQKKKYYLSKDIYTSDHASIASCNSICGYLVEVDSPKEQRFIREMVENTGSYGVLVAGSDAPMQGKWVFLRTGTTISRLHWNQKQAHREEKHCLAYKFNNDHFVLHKTDCNNYTQKNIKYICEVEL